MHQQKSHGFTLIEMSIVIMIIGLIAGGVVVGQSMIENSKMTAVAEERGRIISATTLFQDQYYSLPGDFKQAVGLWGAASGGCPSGARSGTQTCNGDGNGKVEQGSLETYRLWQHLSNAGLLDAGKRYTETWNPSKAILSITAGEDSPSSAWTPRSAWILQYVGKIGINNAYPPGNHGHALILGDEGLLGHGMSLDNGVMSPAQQLRLDKKFDDGKPNDGNILSFMAQFARDCVVGTEYNLSNKEDGCAVIWLTGF